MAHFDNLGKALRRLREQRGWNQMEAVRVIGITASGLSNYETGKKQPSLETFGKLLDAYDLRLGKFDDALDIVNDRPRPVWAEEPTEVSDSTEPNVRALLGISRALPPDLEKALEELLRGFVLTTRALARTVISVTENPGERRKKPAKRTSPPGRRPDRPDQE
jgi:transcriptional regulator with XRE-family HTH domain